MLYKNVPESSINITDIHLMTPPRFSIAESSSFVIANNFDGLKKGECSTVYISNFSLLLFLPVLFSFAFSFLSSCLPLFL
jgi:hypothetical protein